MGMFSFMRAQILTLTDNQSKMPVDHVLLVSETPNITAVSNSRGEVDISQFKGASKIVFSAMGYNTQIKSYDELATLSILELERGSISLDGVVVSALRWEQPSKMVPNKVSSIGPREIALQNPQTAADMLGASGEVFIQKSQQGGGSPMIRGFATNRLLYTVDGVRMNNAIFRGGNIQNVISVNPLTMEGVEVFFGPGSVLYGSDAVGGVMAFQTLTPQLSLSEQPLVTGKALSRYSSANNERTVHFDVNVGWKKWAMLSAVTYSDFDDLRMGSKGPEEYLRKFYVIRMDSVDRVVENENPLVQRPTGYSQMNLMQKVRFSPNNAWNFEYAFHYSETSSYSRYDRLIEQTASGLPRSAVWNYGPQKWMMNLFSVNHTKQTFAYNRMRIRIAQQFFEESRIDRNFSGGQRFRLRNQTEIVHAYSLNADFEKRMNKHELFYGVEGVMNDVRSTGTAYDIRNRNEILVPDRYPQSIWSTYSAYVNYRFEASEKLTLQAGSRYAQFTMNSDFTRHLEFYPFDFTASSLNNGALTGSIGAVYSPTEKIRLHANGSTAFRAPNVDDAGKIFDFVGGEVVVPNTKLKAEYAYSGEVGASTVLAKIIKLDVTGFYTYLNNALVRREFQVNGQDSILYDGAMSKVYAIQNAAFGTVYGFSAGLEIQLPKGFGVSSRYNYQMGIEEMDNGETSRSRHAAPAFGVTRLTYNYNKATMQLYAVYSAAVIYDNLNEEERQKPVIYAKDADGNPWSPSWWTLNFKAGYQISENFSVNAGVENILDKRYRPYSSGLVAPGRNLVISLRAAF